MSTQPINIRPTVSPTNVNVPSALLINAAAPVVDKLVNMAGNAAFNFLGGAYDSAYQHTLGNLTDERTEAFRYAVDSPSYRPRDYVQWIPPRSVSIKYSYKF